MPGIDLTLRVNGQSHALNVQPWERLIDVLRERLDLTGAKEGCGQGECGACTVLLDGRAVLACLMLAVQAQGRELETIEGLQKQGALHPLQEAFIQESAVQCGYCTSGMILTAKALLAQEPDPTPQQIRDSLSNNLCRCTGYERPMRAVLKAAQDMREANHD